MFTGTRREGSTALAEGQPRNRSINHILSLVVFFFFFFSLCSALFRRTKRAKFSREELVVSTGGGKPEQKGITFTVDVST